MDVRGGAVAGGVLPEGMPEVTPTGPEQFYTNPHSFLYGDNGALKYSMPPAYPNEFAFASQVDAASLPYTHSPQQTHQLQFSNPSYSPQTALHSPLPQHAQANFSDPFTAQHLRQHVRQSPSTISPSQLQPQPQQAFHQTPLAWDEFSQFSNGNDHHQLQPLPRPQSTASAPSTLATNIHSNLISTASSWAPPDSGSHHSVAHGTLSGPLNYLAGCHWATVDPESQVPEEWTGMALNHHSTFFWYLKSLTFTEGLQHFWRLKIEEASKQPAKSQKRTSSQALPSSPIDLGGDTAPSKRAKLEKNGKTVAAKKTNAKPLPSDPIERLKEQVIRLMKNPDLSDPGKFSHRFWELMQEAGTDPEKRLALISTAFKEGSPEIWRTYVLIRHNPFLACIKL